MRVCGRHVTPPVDRTGVAAVTALLLLWPPATMAQQPKIMTVGVLYPDSSSSGPTRVSTPFSQSLQNLAWTTNQNIKIEARFAAGRPEAFGPLAAELVARGVDVVVAWGGPAAVAAKRATDRVPVVFLAVGDPIRFGLVSSLARPGGNVTGVSFDVSTDIDVKRLALLKEAVPTRARVGLLVPSTTPRRIDVPTILAAAKQTLKLEVREIEVQSPTDVEAAVRRAKEDGAQALSVWSIAVSAWGEQHSQLAIALRLPSIHWFRESVIAGGLLSYATSLTDIADRGAAYVDRILRGTSAISSRSISSPCHRSLAGTLRPGRPRSPSASGPALQRHRASYRCVDCSADRGLLSRRHRPCLSSPRP
jgi:putative tryptophan/tyrosine transport system substrate-binding protein